MTVVSSKKTSSLFELPVSKKPRPSPSTSATEVPYHIMEGNDRALWISLPTRVSFKWQRLQEDVFKFYDKLHPKQNKKTIDRIAKLKHLFKSCEKSFNLTLNQDVAFGWLEQILEEGETDRIDALDQHLLEDDGAYFRDRIVVENGKEILREDPSKEFCFLTSGNEAYRAIQIGRLYISGFVRKEANKTKAVMNAIKEELRKQKITVKSASFESENDLMDQIDISIVL